MNQFKRQPTASNAETQTTSHSRLRTVKATPGYQQVRTVLLTYLSSILLDSVLERALTERRLSPETLTTAELGELTSDIMVGLRLFVPEQRLPQLMLELAELLELSA
jgi:hypothetical protein